MECEGCFGDLYTLTSLPSLTGLMLTLNGSDEKNAYYSVLGQHQYFSEFEYKYRLSDITGFDSGHLFKITWLGDYPPLGI